MHQRQNEHASWGDGEEARPLPWTETARRQTPYADESPEEEPAGMTETWGLSQGCGVGVWVQFNGTRG